jgi:hypothetical protein
MYGEYLLLTFRGEGYLCKRGREEGGKCKKKEKGERKTAKKMVKYKQHCKSCQQKNSWRANKTM